MPASLTMEQQFKLQVMKEQIKTLTLEEAQNLLLELFEQNMRKDNLFKKWVKG